MCASRTVRYLPYSRLTGLYRPRSFLNAGFRPHIHSFVWCVKFTPNWITFRSPLIWVSRDWYPLVFSGRVRHPLDSKKFFVRDTTINSKLCMSHELCVCVTNYGIPAVFPRDGLIDSEFVQQPIVWPIRSLYVWSIQVMCVWPSHVCVPQPRTRVRTRATNTASA